MKVETVKYFCDDCKGTIKSDDVISVDEHHFCNRCMLSRIRHSISIKKLNRVCKNCKGTGLVKEFYYHNEFNRVECGECKGLGLESL